MRVRSTQLFGMALLSVSLTACGGGGGGSVAPAAQPIAGATASANPNVNTNAGSAGSGSAMSPATVAAADFVGVASTLAASQRADGAIPYTSTKVTPYFANIAATGAARTGADAANVQQWIAWYVTRSRDANPWGIAGAITDYAILANGTLKSTGSADSVDAYAATFLTLVATAWQYGTAAERAYILTIHGDVERIAAAIDAVTDSDGLTWALPSYRVKYVMDASEVYAGLNDLATLRSSAYGDVAGALAASQRAAALRATILATFWNDARGTFAVEQDASGSQTLPDPTAWPDAMVQLAPILHGVIAPGSSTAAGIYGRFNAAFPNWTSLVKPDEYPWASVAFVALQMNDTTRAAAYRSAATARYAPQFAYPWYCAESGWYLRLIDGIIAPQTVAAD
jgi:hypothetical protein